MRGWFTQRASKVVNTAATIKPTKQPNTLKHMDSDTTSKNMSARVAPNARRVPISRVRSRTPVQAVASTPNPETDNALNPIQRTKESSRSDAAICVSSNCFWFSTSKSSGSFPIRR